MAAQAAAGSTWFVDASHAGCPGSGTAADPFCTIGAAIEAASPGDTIRVAAGSYAESVFIDKDALSLVGAGAAVTTIVGDPVSHVVSPSGGFSGVPSFTIEGFRITSSAPDPGFVSGVWANPSDVPGAMWTVRGCIVEGVGTGITANDAWAGAQIVVEDTLVTRCDTGVMAIGTGVAVRRCTIQDIAGVGVLSPIPSSFEVSDTIIDTTGKWAVQRYWGSAVTIQRLLIHDTNQDNPPSLAEAGPFMEYLAEGWPGGFGVWNGFTPVPGPVIEADPLFVDAAAGDVRLLPGSPAIDAGAATTAPPGAPYDLLGFGHPRVDDGDLDGQPRLDLGAIELGGLLSNAGLSGALAVGEILALALTGEPGSAFLVLAGLPGTPLELGAKGTFFLSPVPVVALALGSLPPSGTATVVSGTLPAAAAGLELLLQAAHKGAGPLHWTNAERLEILP